MQAELPLPPSTPPVPMAPPKPEEPPLPVTQQEPPPEPLDPPKPVSQPGTEQQTEQQPLPEPASEESKKRDPKSALNILLKAKKFSDEKNYEEKNKILRGMMEQYPDEFVIDSVLNNKYVGITHVPTSFKIHVPRNIIPPSVKWQVPTMKSANNLTWDDVPDQVLVYANAVRDTYYKVANALLPGTYAWINPFDSRVVVEKSGHVSTCLEKEAIAHDICQPEDSLTEGPPWIMVKSARDLLMSDVFGPAAKMLMLKPSRFSNAIGGPTPLAAMLAGGLLSAGVGYGAGTIAESLAPGVFEKNKSRKRLAMLAGALGTLPGAGLGALGMSTWDSKYNPERDKGSWRAFIRPNVIYGNPVNAQPQGNSFINKASACLKAIQPEISEEMQNAADMFGGGFGGGFGAPSISLEPIPVDAFNRLVLNDPFIAPPMQAATLGVVNAASNIGGPSRYVSPMDIARIGLGMGAGYVQATIGGKVLGALAGLTPEAQKTLQTAGVIAGAVKSVVPGLFGQ